MCVSAVGDVAVWVPIASGPLTKKNAYLVDRVEPVVQTDVRKTDFTDKAHKKHTMNIASENPAGTRWGIAREHFVFVHGKSISGQRCAK